MTDGWWLRCVCVAAAGAVGALTRWGVMRGMQSAGTDIWWGTLAVNAIGCLIFGLVHQLFREELAQHSLWRLIWLTGFCGALTTFSSFAFDLWTLNTTRGTLQAASYCAAQLFIGLAALLVGMALGRWLV